jgi:hypothetical protein
MIPVINEHSGGESSGPPVGHDPVDLTCLAAESAAPIEAQPPQRAAGWTYVDILLFLLFAIPAQLAAVAICIGVFHFFEWVSGAESTFPASLTEAPMVVAVQLVWWMLLLGFIYGVVAVKHQLPFWPAIGWTSLNRPPTVYLLWGILLAFSVAAFSQLMPMPSERMPIEDLIRDRESLILLALYGVLFAPAVEELVFRGFLYKPVERSHGPLLAILVTSVVFSLPHASQYGWRWQNLLLLTYVGVIFGTVRARTQSIVPSTLLHAGYNATLFAGLLAMGDKIFGT